MGGWLSSSDLITIGALASILTAIFTGLVAYIEARKFFSQKISTEWEVEGRFAAPPILKCVIHNNLNSTLDLSRVKLRGPVSRVRTGQTEKHESWADNEAPVSLEIAAGQSGSFSVSFALDMPKASRASSSLFLMPRRWLSIFLWRLFSVRRPSGFKVSIKAVAYTRRSTWRPRRITHNIRINEATVKQIEENAAKSGAAPKD